MSARKHFEGRRLVIATMHGKEQVIAPSLTQALGVEVVVAHELNTDQFGTFSGEVERESDPLETARRKCRTAMALHHCTLAIASEGSFGPHPYLFFVPADDELLVLLDAENGWEFKARELTTQTNFAGASLQAWHDAEQFARNVLFPSHGLIVRKEAGNVADMVKGVSDWDTLKKLVEKYIEAYGRVFLETDMRAMMNPSRMSVIETATKKLLAAIERLCPQCRTPGFDVAQVIEGLPCSQCGAPTRSVLALEYECQHCHYKEQKQHPGGKHQEDPMYCDWCNP